MARSSTRWGVALALVMFAAACSGGGSDSAAPSAAGSEPSTAPESAAPAEPSEAAAWEPEQDITFIVPFPAGSAPDANARVIAQEMENDLGVAVIIQNIEGGASTIGMLELSEAEPDGYSIGLGTAGGMSVQRRIIENPFEGLSVMTPIARTNTVPNVMYASPGRGWDSIETFVEAAAAADEPFTVGLGNKGSSQDIQTALFARAAGIELRPVYFDAGQMVLPAVNGTVDVSVSQFGPMVQYVETDDLAYIGTFLPEPPEGVDVQSFVSAGYDTTTDYGDYEGIFGPAGLAPEIVARIDASVAAAVASDAYAEFAASVYGVPAYLDHDEFVDLVELTDEQAVTIIEELGLDEG